MTALDVMTPDLVEPELPPRAPIGDMRRQLTDRAGDVVAAVGIVLALAGFSEFDGARDYPAAAALALLLVLAAPVVFEELRVSDRITRWIAGSWAAGWALSLAFAQDRSGFVVPVVVAGTVAFVMLLTRRLMRRTAGPAIVVAAILATLGVYASRGLLQWWGSALNGDSPVWLLLSWHNPSGALSGALALLLLGVGLSLRRHVVAGAGLMAAAVGFAGVFLSTSRGALITTALGLVVIAAIAVRRHGIRRSGIRLVVTAAIAAIVVVLLQSMVPTGASTSSRDATDAGADAHFALRLEHMEAGVELAASRAVIGTGPGSYAGLALSHTDSGANLTSHSHSQYVEAWVDGGVLGAGAFIAIGLASLVGLGATWRRRPVVLRSERTASAIVLDDLRAGLVLGAAGTVVHLSAHQAFDTDWTYPVVPFVLAVATAALTTRVTATPPTPSRSAGLAAVGITVVLGMLLVTAGVAGQYQREVSIARDDVQASQLIDATAPWDAARQVGFARLLLDDGRLDLADDLLTRARRWSPGHTGITSLQTELAYRRGEITSTFARSELPPMPTWLDGHAGAAAAMVERGDLEDAALLLADLRAVGEDWASFGIGRVVGDAWLLSLDLAHETGGCSRVRGTLRDLAASSWATGRDGFVTLAGQHVRACTP